jgi:hypothetical protein
VKANWCWSWCSLPLDELRCFLAAPINSLRGPCGPSASSRLLRPLLTSSGRSGSIAPSAVVDSTANRRSPAASSTALRTPPPDLQPATLMDMDFAVVGPFVRHGMPRIRFSTSALTFTPRFFRAPPRDGALALCYHFTSIRLWKGISPSSCQTYSAQPRRHPGRGCLWSQWARWTFKKSGGLEFHAERHLHDAGAWRHWRYWRWRRGVQTWWASGCCCRG